MSRAKKEGKILRFELFRYQILPQRHQQLTLFGDPVTVEELKAQKNDLFLRELNDIRFRNTNGEALFHRFILQEPTRVAFRLGPEKQVMLQDENFDALVARTHPDVVVVVDNDPQVQIMAVSINPKAFSHSHVVANTIETSLNRRLHKYNLEVSINPILDKKDFWALIKRYENKLTRLRFDIIEPNISNISETLGEQLKGLATGTNSLKTGIELNAPKGQTLENINPDNTYLTQVADYATAGGAANVTLHIKGQRSSIRVAIG